MKVRTLVGLRGRATAVAMVLCALVLVGGGVLLVDTLDRQLTSTRDDLSRSRVRDLLDQAEIGALPAVLRNVDDDSVAQVVAADGRVLASSANVQGRPAIVPPASSGPGEARTIEAPDDQETETYRVWVQSGAVAGGTVTVVEGTSLEAVREATSTLRRSLVVGVPLAVLALGLVMWLVLGRALARLDRIRADVDAIGPDQLDRRLPDDGRRDEVGRLATTMNRMLGRVDEAVLRQQRFVADVSHDLQGPLAAQRLSLELALRDPGAVDTAVLRDDVLGATGHLERLVGDLLVLAAADESAPARAVPVDLDEIVLEEALRSAPGSSVVVDTARVSAGPVLGDPAELRRVVRNLLDNAVRHARSRVDLSLHTSDGHAILDVADDGPGVPADQAELVFERFHRGDPARTRGGDGTGLGLAIARSLAERAGGTVVLVRRPPPGAVFRLALPVLR